MPTADEISAAQLAAVRRQTKSAVPAPPKTGNPLYDVGALAQPDFRPGEWLTDPVEATAQRLPNIFAGAQGGDQTAGLLFTNAMQARFPNAGRALPAMSQGEMDRWRARDLQSQGFGGAGTGVEGDPTMDSLLNERDRMLARIGAVSPSKAEEAASAWEAGKDSSPGFWGSIKELGGKALRGALQAVGTPWQLSLNTVDQIGEEFFSDLGYEGDGNFDWSQIVDRSFNMDQWISGSEVLDKAGWEIPEGEEDWHKDYGWLNPVNWNSAGAGRAVAGFGLDVAVDPLTYTPAGAWKISRLGHKAAARALTDVAMTTADDAVRKTAMEGAQAAIQAKSVTALSKEQKKLVLEVIDSPTPNVTGGAYANVPLTGWTAGQARRFVPGWTGSQGWEIGGGLVSKGGPNAPIQIKIFPDTPISTGVGRGLHAAGKPFKTGFSGNAKGFARLMNDTDPEKVVQGFEGMYGINMATRRSRMYAEDMFRSIAQKEAKWEGRVSPQVMYDAMALEDQSLAATHIANNSTLGPAEARAAAEDGQSITAALVKGVNDPLVEANAGRGNLEGVLLPETQWAPNTFATEAVEWYRGQGTNRGVGPGSGVAREAWEVANGIHPGGEFLEVKLTATTQQAASKEAYGIMEEQIRKLGIGSLPELTNDFWAQAREAVGVNKKIMNQRLPIEYMYGRGVLDFNGVSMRGDLVENGRDVTEMIQGNINAQRSVTDDYQRVVNEEAGVNLDPKVQAEDELYDTVVASADVIEDVQVRSRTAERARTNTEVLGNGERHAAAGTAAAAARQQENLRVIHDDAVEAVVGVDSVTPEAAARNSAEAEIILRKIENAERVGAQLEDVARETTGNINALVKQRDALRRAWIEAVESGTTDAAQASDAWVEMVQQVGKVEDQIVDAQHALRVTGRPIDDIADDLASSTVIYNNERAAYERMQRQRDVSLPVPGQPTPREWDTMLEVQRGKMNAARRKRDALRRELSGLSDATLRYNDLNELRAELKAKVDAEVASGAIDPASAEVTLAMYNRMIPFLEPRTSRRLNSGVGSGTWKSGWTAGGRRPNVRLGNNLHETAEAFGDVENLIGGTFAADPSYAGVHAFNEGDIAEFNLHVTKPRLVSSRHQLRADIAEAAWENEEIQNALRANLGDNGDEFVNNVNNRLANGDSWADAVATEWWDQLKYWDGYGPITDTGIDVTRPHTDSFVDWMLGHGTEIGTDHGLSYELRQLAASEYQQSLRSRGYDSVVVSLDDQSGPWGAIVFDDANVRAALDDQQVASIKSQRDIAQKAVADSIDEMEQTLAEMDVRIDRMTGQAHDAAQEINRNQAHLARLRDVQRRAQARGEEVNSMVINEVTLREDANRLYAEAERLADEGYGPAYRQLRDSGLNEEDIDFLIANGAGDDVFPRSLLDEAAGEREAAVALDDLGDIAENRADAQRPRTDPLGNEFDYDLAAEASLERNLAQVARHEAEAMTAEADLLKAGIEANPGSLDAAAAEGRKMLEVMADPDTAEDILAAGFQQTGVVGRQVPEYIANALTETGHLQHAGQAGFKQWDAITNMFKAYAVFSPGFHVRNAVGAYWNNFLANISPGAYTTFGKYYFGTPRKPGYWRHVQKGATHEQAMARVRANHTKPKDQAAINLFDEAMSHGSARGGKSADIMDVTSATGYRGTTQTGQMPKTSWLNPFVPRWAPLKANVFAGETVEEFFRGALAMDVMRQGGTADDALEAVWKYHFNYDDLSTFEQSWARRAVPFYTWTRKNIPLQVSEFIRKPAKFNRWNQLRENLEYNKEVVDILPGWQAEQMGYLNLGTTGLFGTDDGTPRNVSMFADLPFTKLGENFDEGSMLGSVNPLLRLPYEFAFSGTESFTGKRITGKWVPIPTNVGIGPLNIGSVLEPFGIARKNEAGEWEVKDNWFYFLENISPPIARASRQLPSTESGKRGGETVTAWLRFAGVPIRVITEREKLNEIQYGRNSMLEGVIRDLESQDIEVPKEAEGYLLTGQTPPADAEKGMTYWEHQTAIDLQRARESGDQRWINHLEDRQSYPGAAAFLDNFDEAEASMAAASGEVYNPNNDASRAEFYGQVESQSGNDIEFLREPASVVPGIEVYGAGGQLWVEDKQRGVRYPIRAEDDVLGRDVTGALVIRGNPVPA